MPEDEFAPQLIICLAAREKHVGQFTRDKENVMKPVCLSLWDRAKLYFMFAIRMQGWKLKDGWDVSWQEKLRMCSDKDFLQGVGKIAEEVLCKVLRLSKIDSVAFVVTMPRDLRTGQAFVCAIQSGTTATGIVMVPWKDQVTSTDATIHYCGPAQSAVVA